LLLSDALASSGDTTGDLSTAADASTERAPLRLLKVELLSTALLCLSTCAEYAVATSTAAVAASRHRTTGTTDCQTNICDGMANTHILQFSIKRALLSPPEGPGTLENSTVRVEDILFESILYNKLIALLSIHRWLRQL
jgi:hypothetical protein